MLFRSREPLVLDLPTGRDPTLASDTELVVLVPTMQDLVARPGPMIRVIVQHAARKDVIPLPAVGARNDG